MAGNVKAGNRKRAAAVHKKNTKERAAAAQGVKALYMAEAENPVLIDIITKAQSFVKYHTKMAQDGVGVRKTGHVLENGTAEVETVYYTTEKRVGELDKAAGILELLDYIERQLKMPEPTAKPK